MDQASVGTKNYLSLLAAKHDKTRFKVLHEEMSFNDYVARCYQNPRLVRTAYQRLYDMIMSKGCRYFKRFRRTHVHYNFFDDFEVPIVGLEDTLEEFVKFVRGAAGGYGTEKRILLLHGPVGSAKSTICRILKKGFEEYSRSDEGAWYTFKWVNLPTGPTGIYTHSEDLCAMHDDPLRLIPSDIREGVLSDLNKILKQSIPEDERSGIYTLKCDGELDPRSRKFMNDLLDRYEGDWERVIQEHIRVVRMLHSEADRLGIATFQPKDEKNQDSTELTGDVNYSKLTHFGSDSDPRAFNYDGEFCAGNRGFVEFIEMLKLDKVFLYDLLGASQEQQIKPKKFSQIRVDLVLVGHTNNPEYEKLKSDQTMEALRDRTVKIDVPYLLRWSDELRVLEHYYGPHKVRQHIAPHTLEIAALFAILTRLQEDKDRKLSLVDKAKLYDGRSLPGWTEDSVKELRDKYQFEGMAGGVSCRYIQDKVSNSLSAHNVKGGEKPRPVNVFTVLNEIRDGLDGSSLITNKDEIGKYLACADLALKEYEEIVKAEVQQALVGNADAAGQLCQKYIDNIMAYIDHGTIINPLTQKEEQPNEKLMRSIEEKIEIPEVAADDFRRALAGYIGKLAHKDEKFGWESDPRLKKAIERKLFEDLRDTINIARFSTASGVADPETQARIDTVKARLIKSHGYNEQSAADVLEFVSTIFARSDTQD